MSLYLHTLFLFAHVSLPPQHYCSEPFITYRDVPTSNAKDVNGYRVDNGTLNICSYYSTGQFQLWVTSLVSGGLGTDYFLTAQGHAHHYLKGVLKMLSLAGFGVWGNLSLRMLNTLSTLIYSCSFPASFVASLIGIYDAVAIYFGFFLDANGAPLVSAVFHTIYAPYHSLTLIPALLSFLF